MKRYNKLKKEKNRMEIKNKKAKQVENYNKKMAQKTYKKFGYARSMRGSKLSRAAFTGGAIVEGLASANFMNQSIKSLKSGNKLKAGLYAAASAITGLASASYVNLNKDYKQRQSYYRDYEYNKLDKKYGKIIK
jgi:hypothetical protein